MYEAVEMPKYMKETCTCTRPYDHKGDVSDRNVRAWQIGMRRHGRLVCVSMSYNVKRKSCNNMAQLIHE